MIFYQIFLSPQVKRCAIITYKHGIYELPHTGCQKTQDFKDLRKLGNIGKVSIPHRMIAQRPAPRQNENSANASKVPLKNRN